MYSTASLQSTVQDKKFNWQFAMTSDQPVELLDLSLDLHTSNLEKKPSLSVSSVESLYTHAHTHKTITVSLAHAPRVNKINYTSLVQINLLIY